jgi:amino acid transporter
MTANSSATHLDGWRPPGRPGRCVAEAIGTLTGPAGIEAFPSASTLPRTVSWRSPVLVSLGGALLVTVSLGPMAHDLGNLAWIVWLGTAAIGAVQCALLAELTSRFPNRSGGTAQFAYRAVRNGSPSLGALSSWSYWFGWTPGIAVNLILAATYLRNVLWPSVNPLILAAVIGVALYALNWFGLRLNLRITALLGLVCIVPLGVVMIGPVLKPSVFHASRILPIVLHDSNSHAGPLHLGLLIMKWAFVAAWAAYAAEMASTLCAEVRNCSCDMPRAMAWSAGLCLAAFGILPLTLVAIVGIPRMEQDPLTTFLPAAEILFGSYGKTALAITLALALILAAQAFILSSSRTIYQITLDGHLPRFFARVNRHGVPVGSIGWDAAVLGLMLLVFGTHVVDVVAAANVGYLIVFILMPVSYIVLRARGDGNADGLRLPRSFIAVAIALAVLNTLLLVVGGVQWGASTMLIGLGVSLLIIPISWLTRATAAVSSTTQFMPAVRRLVRRSSAIGNHPPRFAVPDWADTPP